jgi:hypothetical protein
MKYSQEEEDLVKFDVRDLENILFQLVAQKLELCSENADLSIENA